MPIPHTTFQKLSAYAQKLKWWHYILVFLLILVLDLAWQVSKLEGLAWSVGAPVQRYLVVLQNDSELRPTGGFIGAYALLETGWGIPHIEVHDSYDLVDHKAEEAPEKIRKLLDDGVWYDGHYFRDANVSPDWPTSAQELIRFYSRNFSTPQEFDGVLAVNLGAIEDLVQAIGGVQVGGTYLDKTNLFYALEANLRPDDAHSEKSLSERKDPLKDLSKALILSAFKPWNWGPMADSLHASLEKKDLLVYFTDESDERGIAGKPWAGRLATPDRDQDFLHVNLGNYAGKKTDRYLDSTIDYQVKVDEGGQAIATLTLTMSNRETESTLLAGSWFGWVRIYTPKGSELLSGKAWSTMPDTTVEATENLNLFDTSEDLDLTVFDKDVSVLYGETQTFVLTYRLPQKFDEQYGLNIVRQSGVEPMLNVDIKAPDQRFWQSTGTPTHENHLFWRGELTRDLNFSGKLLPDTFPPFVVNQHLSDLNTLWVDTSEPLALSRAIIPDNFIISDLDQMDPRKKDLVKVTGVEHFENVLKITLEGMTDQPEERYALTLKDQYDRAGNPMGEKTVTIVQRFQ